MHTLINQLLSRADHIILGKSLQVRLAVCCLFCKGHLLIEDIPGVGKTTLAHTLAILMGMNYQRIQFTSDLLPSDIIGASIFDVDNHTFKFHPGPIFNQMVLADEINRSTPKSQSALLEAMEEQQVTVEGKTYPLPTPFFVIATQNPSHQLGTFPLPESQLDRFLMRIELGYPDHQAERELLKGSSRRSLIEKLTAHMSAEQLFVIQQKVIDVHVSDALLDYLQGIIAYTRISSDYAAGLSPRAGIALLHAAKAWAYMANRDAVLPEDVQAVLPSVAGHRLKPGSHDSQAIVAPILENVPVF
ncbi:MAG: AAA family ATPase [Methylicorpusculum sp.]|uniref:AAA family ATPase n=1 Tax=Methylicorpusculum sp. TaxID=2713644 RepID=UPI0027277C2A|nr:AAA family ATPase [Methylicorpusculum sp.]MDO8845292.1 AAA family ATPase [Methylicorpusculum sp.]MDO8940967.1 AAA family ATPase [Methylicorpusculum sp.]MDP2177833.1 AAA family ATPase [Methylicorpusculum sp.]MDP2200860.1 AAA family ATPase [Methylicorpusculum sp.]MDP3529873.1 AAA family ATPase [Methylicorpusculum sp.]